MTSPNALPSARRERLVVEQVGNETLIYDLDKHQAHSLNEAAVLVWKACDGTKTIEELAEVIPGELTQDEKQETVRLALEQLSQAHLLSSPVNVEVPVSSSRRALLLKIGVAAAVATLPLITSIGVPTAQAQSADGVGVLAAD